MESEITVEHDIASQIKLEKYLDSVWDYHSKKPQHVPDDSIISNNSQYLPPVKYIEELQFLKQKFQNGQEQANKDRKKSHTIIYVVTVIGAVCLIGIILTALYIRQFWKNITHGYAPAPLRALMEQNPVVIHENLQMHALTPVGSTVIAQSRVDLVHTEPNEPARDTDVESRGSMPDIPNDGHYAVMRAPPNIYVPEPNPYING